MNWLNAALSNNTGQRYESDRRIYAYERTWNRRPINAYLAIDRFRSGDDWIGSRDSLQSFVQSQLLRETARYPVDSISLYRVWAEIIPQVRPSHWITGGYRSQIERFEKTSIVKVPVCLHSPRTGEPLKDGMVVEKIGGPIGFAIDSLPPPETMVICNRDKLVFAATLLSALSLEVRDILRNKPG